MIDLTELSVDNIENQGVEASTGVGNFKVLDPGDYNVMIMDVTTKSTKAGNGEGLTVKFSVIDGNDQGTEFKSWFNIKNKNEQAAKLGLSEVLAMVKVAGVAHAGELEGKAIRVRLYKEVGEINPKTGKPYINNSIKKFMTTSGKDAKGGDVEPFKAAPVEEDSAQVQGGGGSEKPLFDSAPDF